MLQRCTNPKSPQWKWYGGRGIKVVPRWLGKNGFDHFFEDMGAMPDSMTLERKNNDLNYGPKNCRWATWKEQAANRRPAPPKDINSLRQKALRAGLPYHMVYQRIKILGWTEAEALEAWRTPNRERRGRPRQNQV